jgi:hypothetical protein
VKLRTFDRITKIEQIEIVTVDAGGGDAAAEMAQALRPTAMVVGVTPKGGFGPVGGGAGLEAEDTPADDEDAGPGPSNRELAMMQPTKRGPGRPRKDAS